MKKLESKKSYENLQNNVRSLKMPKIDTFRNMYADKDYWVELGVPEFTCICPKTGQPDFATLKIRYQPDKYCIELKSFKYYINGYRSLGIFHEHVANRILDDFVHSCKPRAVNIVGEFNPRGGIKTTVCAEYKRE